MDDDPADGDEAYATTVEEAFIAERGTPFLLSAKDWNLIRGWRREGIPVETVVRAVREAFARRRERGAAGKISSISYCANAVEERWEMERRGLVGARPLAPPVVEGVAERLSRLVSTFRAAAGEGRRPDGFSAESWASAGAKGEAALAAIDPAPGFDVVEEQLSAAEAAVVRTLKGGLSEGAAAEVEAAVVEALGGTETMGSQAREKVRRALERREIRRRSGLPPLTLFDA